MKTDHLKVLKEDVFALAPIRWKQDSVTYAADKPFVTPYGTVRIYAVSNVVVVHTRSEYDTEGTIYVPSFDVSSSIPDEYLKSSTLMFEKSDKYFFDSGATYTFPLETRMVASWKAHGFGPLHYDYYVWYCPLHLCDYSTQKRNKEGLVCLLEARLGFGLPSYNSDKIPVVRLRLFEPVPLRVLCGIDSEEDAPKEDDYSSS